MAKPNNLIDPEEYMIVVLANGQTVSVSLTQAIGAGFDASDNRPLFSADDLATVIAKHDLTKGA